MYPKWNCHEYPQHECFSSKGCCPDEQESCGKSHCHEQICCDIPKIPCKPKKECVETFKCSYKLYRISYYRLYKQCGQCGHEYDHQHHQGMCPKCGRL